MNKRGLENGGDRLLLIIGGILASFILLLAMVMDPPVPASKQRFCMDYCHSEYRKKNTLHDITGVFRKNIELTKCFKQCTR